MSEAADLTHLRLLAPLQKACVEPFQVINRDTLSGLFRNRSNSIGISGCFEFLLMTGVVFDFF